MDPIVIDEAPASYLTPPKPMRGAVPSWYEDGFTSEAQADTYYAELVQQLYEESVRELGPKKLRWEGSDKLIELEHILDAMTDRTPENTRVSFLPAAMEEWMAVRHQDPLRPTANARQMAMNDTAAACNIMMGQILDDNFYNLQRLRVGIDQLKFRMAFLSPTVNPFKPGLYDQPGLHSIDRVDPRHVWPDPLADSWDFKKMKYCIIARPMDKSDIIRRWPERGHLIKMSGRYSLDRQETPNSNVTSGFGRIQSPFNKAGQIMGNRDRALVLECYLFDCRLRPVAIGEDGRPVYNPSGEEIFRWDERYPRGRLFVACNDVLLFDSENPWNHGTVPLVPYPESVYDGLFSYSPLDLLDLYDRKLNLITKEAYGNLRVWMNSPWVIDRNAFTKPSQYENITQKPETIFIVRPNSRINRLPPSDLPQSFFSMFDQLKNLFDQVLGVNNVSRGDLQQGAQMSADTVQGLQGAALKRILMKTEIDKESTKLLGQLLVQNIRQFYKVPKTLVIKDPLGQDKQIEWDNSKFKNVWDIAIEAGNTAGAEVSSQQRAAELFKLGAIDDLELLKTLRWPQAEDVVQRKREWKMKLALSGFVKEAMKDGNVSRGPSKKVARV